MKIIGRPSIWVNYRNDIKYIARPPDINYSRYLYDVCYKISGNYDYFPYYEKEPILEYAYDELSEKLRG